MVYHKIFQAYETVVESTNALFSVCLVAAAHVRCAAIICVCRTWQDDALADSLCLNEKGQNLALPVPLPAENPVLVPGVQGYRPASGDQGYDQLKLDSLIRLQELSMNIGRLAGKRSSIKN